MKGKKIRIHMSILWQDDKYSSAASQADFSLHFAIPLKGLDLIYIHVARRSQQRTDLKMTFYSALFVKRPSLCRNYDSASGMWRRVPRWHLLALLRDNNSNSAKRAGVLSGRSPPRVSHAAPEASPPSATPPFVRQGQGTKC